MKSREEAKPRASMKSTQGHLCGHTRTLLRRQNKGSEQKNKNKNQSPGNETKATMKDTLNLTVLAGSVAPRRVRAKAETADQYTTSGQAAHPMNRGALQNRLVGPVHPPPEEPAEQAAAACTVAKMATPLCMGFHGLPIHTHERNPAKKKNVRISSL